MKRTKLEDVRTDLLIARDGIEEALALLDEPHADLLTWQVFLAKQIIAIRDAINRIVSYEQ